MKIWRLILGANNYYLQVMVLKLKNQSGKLLNLQQRTFSVVEQPDVKFKGGRLYVFRFGLQVYSPGD
jgi:hypothetical protein